MELAGVDLDHLGAWMDERELGSGPLVAPEVLSGGTQNILIRFERAERAFVLRRPPISKRANSDETIRREIRVLGAIAGSGVPHPRLIAGEPDAEVLGAAFYLMESVDGFNPLVEVPEPHRSDAAMQHRMGLAMADALAALSAVDVAAAGLADLSRTDGWAGRQAGRWRSQLDSYAAFDGYTPGGLIGVDKISRWLEMNCPADTRVGLIHGDYQFANVLFSRVSPELAAVVDWELAALGDPRLDLGHLLAVWPGVVPSATSTPLPALPSPLHVIARYEQRTQRQVENLTWFRVLAAYRLGLILEGTYARACAGLAPLETGDQLHRMTVDLLALAERLIEEGSGQG